MVRLALYKGTGRWTDRVIRWRTSSAYSHCEIVLDTGYCYSSSPRDGGVRRKLIDLETGNWDFIWLPGADAGRVLALWDETAGAGYDWLGVLVGQAFYVRMNRSRRWFCSEWCAAALGYGQPWRYSPGSLSDALLGAGGRLIALPRSA